MAFFTLMYAGLAQAWNLLGGFSGYISLGHVAFFGLGDDEDRAGGGGVGVRGAKVFPFAVSVGITAMIGGAWAYYIGYVYPQYAVDPLVMIGSLLPVFLGGAGTLWGPVIGAFILIPAQQSPAPQYGDSGRCPIALPGRFPLGSPVPPPRLRPLLPG